MSIEVGVQFFSKREITNYRKGKTMRLFHVSEEPDIKVFEPRLPTRKDLNQNIGLVWAIDEARLPNFLTPPEIVRGLLIMWATRQLILIKNAFSLPMEFHMLSW